MESVKDVPAKAAQSIAGRHTQKNGCFMCAFHLKLWNIVRESVYTCPIAQTTVHNTTHSHSVAAITVSNIQTAAHLSAS